MAVDASLAYALGGAGLFGLGAALNSWRARVEAWTHARGVAEERGLGPAEIAQLEHLGRYADHASLSDLLISPIRYDRAVAAYVADLRRQERSPAHYFGIIVELTRLRRRVHPPGQLLRWLVSTRELPEAADIQASAGAWSASGVVWSVNEDHIDLRLGGDAPPECVEPQSPLNLRLSLPGHGVYEFTCLVRGVTPSHKGVVRVEHSQELARDNRREFLREPISTPVFVTPEGASAPLRATLRDLSGGGLSFVTDTELTAGECVKIMLPLEESEGRPLLLWATALRCDPEDGGFRVQGAWHELTTEQREAIIRSVWDLQRLRIRRVKAAARLDAVPCARALVIVPDGDPK